MAFPDAIDLLSKMLVYDKNLRINCKDAMAHSYFDPIREFIAKFDADKAIAINASLNINQE